jgi:hypothetical protein
MPPVLTEKLIGKNEQETHPWQAAANESLQSHEKANDAEWLRIKERYICILC